MPPSLTPIAHPGLQTEQFTYDAEGNLKTHDDGRGGITETLEYDSLNQAKRIKDGAGNVTRFEYDGGGLLLAKTEPKGEDYRTTYRYNAFGSLTQVTEPQQPAWTFGYDNAQNLTSVRDPLNRFTSYEYDAMNRMSKTIQPLGRTTEYTYDKNSNVASVRDPKNQTATMTYDALDRLASTRHQAGGSLDREYQYDYDAEDNLWRVFDSRTGEAPRISTRIHDRRNRLTQTTDAAGKSVQYSFDAADNLTRLTSGTRFTSYDYDAKNRLDTVKQDGVQTADYDWFADGLLRKVAYPNGTSRNFAYDDADRVTNITNNFGASQSENYVYAYDANSNRISEIRKDNNVAKRTAAYDYDKLDRLTRADYTANVQELPLPPLGEQISYSENTDQNAYGYDAVGNRINETTKTQTKTVTISNTVNGISRSEQTSTSPEQTTTATFNDLNELTQLNEPSGASYFTYDNNGNLTEIRKNSTVTAKYEYDIRNQLTKAKDGSDNELARFDYDFERKRVSKTNAIGTTNYVYAGSEVISEFAGGANSANYTIGAGEIVKSEFANGENNFHFTDALGSVTALLNSDNSLTRNEYNAFGEISTTGSTANSIGYTGQRLDNETGLMPLGNGERYYSPTYARFIQQDSWTGSLMNGQSLNRFTYGYNNPFSYTDPSGNIADDNRGSLANSARNYGLDPNGNNNWWNIAKNWAARTGYDLWDTASLGTLSRQEETVAQVEKGEITQEQFEKQTGNNAALGFAKVGLMIATAGIGNAAVAGAGLTTRIGVGAGLGVAEQFGNDALEMAFGFRKDFSPAGTYAISSITGGLFGAATPGKAATAFAKEGKLTLGTELRLLKQEASELGQNIGQRLNPRNYSFKFNENVLGSNSGGLEIEYTPKKSVESPTVTYQSYETPYKPLGKTRRELLDSKLSDRSITKGEYEHLQWDRRFANRRREGIRAFWRQERIALRRGEQTARRYSPSQKEEILSGKTPTFEGQPLEGHHRYNALDYPQLADKPFHIYPVTKNEHLYRWHGGSFRNRPSGKPLNPTYKEEF